MNFRSFSSAPLRSSAPSLRRLPKTIKNILNGPLPSAVDPPSANVRGWVRHIRKHKHIAFVTITDGTSIEPLQVVSTPERVKGLFIGSSVSLTGTLARSHGAGQPIELQEKEITVLGHCDLNEYPLQKKHQLPTYTRELPHLRPRTEVILGVLKLRDKATRAFHEYFESQEFTYVHPPLLTSNDCEGAGEAFRVTTDALLSRGPNPQTTDPKDIPPTDTPVPEYPEYFDRPTYLTVSSQLHLEALSAALSRVYTISPTFRAERSKTHRHLSEFSMLEAEIAFCDDLEDVMSVAERSIKDVFRNLRTHAFPEVGFFRDFRTKYGDKQVDVEFRAGEGPVSTEVAGSEHDLFRMMDDLSAPGVRWARMTHAEAVKELQQYQDRHPGVFVYPVGPRLPLQSEHEKWLAGNLIDGPVFITDYPASLKPFYMRENDLGRSHRTEGEPTVACFDLLVPRVGELVGGSLREERLDRLLQAMRARNMRTEEMQWYLDLRRFGTFPHGGFGMGFERFISWVTGLENIRDCLPFPRSIGKIAL